jgi:hypothetical protein
MFRHANNIPFFILFIFFFFACEGNTDKIRFIQNSSESAILVTANGGSLTDYTNTIAAGQTDTLFFGGQLGGTSQIENPAFGIDTLIIVNAAGDTCTKEYTLQDNWIISVEQIKKRPSNWRHEYTFQVNEGDF